MIDGVSVATFSGFPLVLSDLLRETLQYSTVGDTGQARGVFTAVVTELCQISGLIDIDELVHIRVCKCVDTMFVFTNKVIHPTEMGDSLL